MRIASCRCGSLKAECAGEPVRISICHCLECQRRTGSVFSAQARFPANSVTITGTFRTFERNGDAGSRLTYQFCPKCGATVAYYMDVWPAVVAIPIGAFADPEFPAPIVSAYERRQHHWVAIAGATIEHID
jgi:hypothetical protein